MSVGTAIHVEVDASHCSHCGVCSIICPEVFRDVEAHADRGNLVRKPIVEDRLEQQFCRDAAACCPKKAIVWKPVRAGTASPANAEKGARHANCVGG